MELGEFLAEIEKLGLKEDGRYKPHKQIALLAILQLVDEHEISENKILYDEQFKSRFKELLGKYGLETDTNRPHNPFFHLRSSTFWLLCPKPGEEEALQKASSIGSPGDLLRMVSHAQFSEDACRFVFEKISREAIEDKLKEHLNEYAGERGKTKYVSAHGGTSLYEHENNAINQINEALRLKSLGITLNNIEIHDAQTNRYFEIDLLVISPFGIYVVELKHWSGNIEVKPNSWIQNGSFYKVDPHKTNNFKAKQVKGKIEHQFPHFPQVYVESVVVFTNPEVVVAGASNPSAESHNPTLDSVERFVQYLVNQRKQKEERLSDGQCRAFSDYLAKLQVASKPKAFQFPGYEVVEILYQYDDRAEIVARRIDLRHQKLSRLRIFYPPSTANSEEKAVFHERATATLNAVEKTGDHPNILKVWAVPNENNYIVEGSDWSETGTLRDYLDKEKRLDPDQSVSIIAGVLQGLDVIHRQCVIHRSLSPENILMVEGVPKIMNFDLSFQLEDDRTTVIPDPSELKRSPYIAPEVYGGLSPEASADLFSVGTILYEMLAGERPFRNSLLLKRNAHDLLESKREKLEECNVPAALQELILDLLEPEPEKRLQNVASVLTRLKLEEMQEDTDKTINPVLLQGETFGLYCIEELVKSGSESQIYRARGMQAKQVALKLFNVDVPLSRVVNEQKFAAAYHHPSIAWVDSYGPWGDGRFFIAFNWIAGDSMWEEIEKGKRPDSRRFKNVARQLCEALEGLHGYTDAEGITTILHNDIKPENIIITEERPVLIDFGTASTPHVGIYEGTAGYVAPELILGQDRNYCVAGDIYALGISLYQWLFGVHPSKGLELTALQEINPEASETMLKWLEGAIAEEPSERYASISLMKELLRGAQGLEVEKLETTDTHETQLITPALADVQPITRVSLSRGQQNAPNPFVAYLNSLHSRSADCENSLAESQSRNEHFGHIQVAHPVASIINEYLTSPDGKSVILTGHAGDGKSTIALELYKQYMNIDLREKISSELRPREDLNVNSIHISIIKDLSEWSPEKRHSLLEEVLANTGKRYLLVSNTGTLLETFRDYERSMGGDWVSVESDILKNIENAQPADLEFRSMGFVTINLSMVDNLKLAREVFERMIDPARWEDCRGQDCVNSCPILKNVRLLQENQATALERIFLVYRRMYEYGIRFTLRQMTAHLAYMLTSGLNYADIEEMSKKASTPLLSEFLFFNRFFGDNGICPDLPSLQIKAIQVIRKQGFGMHLNPAWERVLWSYSEGMNFKLKATGMYDDFEALRRRGGNITFDTGITDSQARIQVRRILYFLHKFKDENDPFIPTFLGSPMILRFLEWQADIQNDFSLNELRVRIMHVLQEHFTGIRMPEGAFPDSHVYITLNRRTRQVRQSAQVVLARFPQDEFKLKLSGIQDAGGTLRKQLALSYSRGDNNPALELGLPFLDYVVQRSLGEVGEELQASYVHRLEGFKGELLKIGNAFEQDSIMLVRLLTNHAFKRQTFTLHNNRLEVFDD